MRLPVKPQPRMRTFKPHDILPDMKAPSTRLRGAILVTLLLVPAGAADPIAPEILLLARIKQKARQGLADVPAYACSETMERFSRTSNRYNFHKVDQVNLEVAEIGGKELFAKAGSRSFDDRDLMHLVGSGLIATGMFYHMAKNLLDSPAPRFQYAGRKKIRGHASVQYDFEVSAVFAGYQLDFNGYKANCGMKGSIWADENSYDLIRVRIEATDMLPQMRVKEAITEIDYGRAALDGQSFLIPTASDIVIISNTWREEKNQIRFSKCHKYGVESILTFQ
jgi:hypothetical protein